MIEFLIWAPDRAIFAATMSALTLPDGSHIARLPEEGEHIPDGGSIITLNGVLCSEVGPITKTPAVLDPETGEELTPAVIIPGYHANMAATGALAQMMTEGMPTEGDIFARTRLLSFLGTMEWMPSAVGEPEGYVGASGIKVFDPSAVNHRARVWA